MEDKVPANYCPKCHSKFNSIRKTEKDTILLGTYLIPRVRTIIYFKCPKCNYKNHVIISSKLLTSENEQL